MVRVSTTYFAPSGSKPPFGRSILRHGISLLCSSFLTHPILYHSTESLRHLTKRVLFFVSLAIAKRVGEVQAVSGTVSFVCHDTSLSYVPEFVTKTVFISNPLPRSFLVASWSDFAAGLDDELLLYLSAPSVFLLIRTSSLFLLFLVVFFCPRDALLRLC